MNILVVLVPIALSMAGLALWAFIAAAKNGQFDDLETPAYRALLEAEERKNNE